MTDTTTIGRGNYDMLPLPRGQAALLHTFRNFQSARCKYLPGVLKSFHNSTETVDEFNVAYGYLGPMMYSMFMQKEKSLTTTASTLHPLATPRSSLQLTQRPAQIVIQQQPSTPVPPSSPFLTPTPSLSSITPRPLSTLPSTPTGVTGQKFVIVSQSRPATPIAPPTPTTQVMKLVGPPQPPLTPTNTAAPQKIVVIQGGPKADDGGASVRTAVIGGSQTGTLVQQPVTSTTTTSITGKETL